MTWNSTMSSGYSSLEEDSEEYFFTARTSFFRKPLGKVSESKVRAQNTRLLSAPDRWMKIIRCFKFFFLLLLFQPGASIPTLRLLHSCMAVSQDHKRLNVPQIKHFLICSSKTDATFLGKEKKNPPAKFHLNSKVAHRDFGHVPGIKAHRFQPQSAWKADSPVVPTWGSERTILLSSELSLLSDMTVQGCCFGVCSLEAVTVANALQFTAAGGTVCLGVTAGFNGIFA